MGRGLKHIDKGVAYISVDNHTEQEINELKQIYRQQGKTVVLLKGGKCNMKEILKQIIRGRL